jgi:hypothetical protein
VIKAPEWWEWKFDSVASRGLTEAVLREMLAQASSCKPDRAAGQFLIETTFEGAQWHVIVAPDHARKDVAVILAYRPPVPSPGTPGEG